MQFVKNGPEIPNHLLQAHEEGRVIFFCGAGISYPADLPGFDGLVKALASKVGARFDVLEQAAFNKQQFDTVIDLLEHRLPGQRNAIRSQLNEILKPKFRKSGATDTHQALINLSRDSDGCVRLVTTNFDRIFNHLIKTKKMMIPEFCAPFLPIPKNSRWNGVVYLHGYLPKKPDKDVLNRLVLSSGDFGLAYLTERWAARFVSELFRNYTVCFVGYSINDPVMRYMMDALAADKLLGESAPQAYAFGAFAPGQKLKAASEWAAKRVEPILYEAPTPVDHFLLHETLKIWAATHRDGVLGKEAIITRHAINPPIGSTVEDDFIGRVLWAISDKTGLPARTFSELNPVPPLKWLEPFSDNQFGHSDLVRFGVSPLPKEDTRLRFSLAKRPSPYSLAAQMSLVSSGVNESGWDLVMHALGQWLLRHLDDPKLILWIAKSGGQLSNNFQSMVRRRLREIETHKQKGDITELEALKSGAPSAVPCRSMQTLWSLALSGQLLSIAEYGGLYEWLEQFRSMGLTVAVRNELRKLLAPRVRLSEPYFLGDSERNAADEPRVGDLVRWEIELASDYPFEAFDEIKDSEIWIQSLPNLLNDFNGLLLEAMDLNRELGGSSDKYDRSYSDRPSISDHDQNNRYRGWTILIELLRSSWTAINGDQQRAASVAAAWWETPYPIFKRLALYAASVSDVVPSYLIVKWLSSENSWWLWSEEVRREVMRVLVLRGSSLSQDELDALTNQILQGPHREMFRDEMELDAWGQIRDHDIWLRLAKLTFGGAKLPRDGTQKLLDISAHNPGWAVAVDERDEFPLWMSSGWIDGAKDPLFRTAKAVPRRRKDIVHWLRDNPARDNWERDDWRQRCSETFPATACALISLSREGEWPSTRWMEALQAWSDERLSKKSWRYLGPLVASAPDTFIENCARAISYWIHSASKYTLPHEPQAFILINRILESDVESGLPSDDPVGKAINHPIGHVVQAALKLWYQQPLVDDQSLEDPFRQLFTKLGNTTVEKFRHARVILASHVISLFRVDQEWTTQNVLKLFDWDISAAEAKSVWEGFLWNPRLYRPLLVEMKNQILQTTRHYNELGEHAQQYADFLTFIALESDGIFSTDELADAFLMLPAGGLEHSSRTLIRALAGSGEMNSEYWSNRIKPFFHNIWPKSVAINSASISRSFAELCVEAGASFGDAISTLKSWIEPIDHPAIVVHRLQLKNMGAKFPEPTLELLSLIIGDETQWLSSELADCLRNITHAIPDLARDTRYIKLIQYLRVKGINV